MLRSGSAAPLRPGDTIAVRIMERGPKPTDNMPAPIPGGSIIDSRAVPSGHLPALDGLRALAVVAVLLFHGGVSWAHGGYLGVDLFFVLSGFLIANKLLGEQERDGRISLREFWIGRIRRLLPAALLVLTAVSVYIARFAEPVARRGIRDDTWAALLYVANWRFIVSDVGYFASSAAPSPVRHLWSLSVEEQFYVLFPLLLVGLAALGRRSRALTGPFLALIAASVLWTAILREGGAEVTRLYEGTDTRLATILVGALAAVLLRSRREAPLWLGPITPLAALAALAITAAAHGTEAWLYPWGQLVFAVATAVVIASAATRPGAPSTTLLSTAPLVGIGQLSYSLYLWHWPVYLVLTPERTALDGAALLIVRVLLSGVLAFLSHRLVEQPIRLRRVRMALPGALAVTAILSVGALAAVAASGAPDGDVDFAARRGEGGVLSAGTVGDLPPLEVPDGTPVPPAAPRDRPLRVALVGDSAAASLEFYRPEFADIAYDGATTIGCGIMGPARPVGQELKDSCRDWRERWPRGLGSDPDVVLVVLGAWEINEHELPGGGRYLPDGPDTDPDTTAFLDERLEEAVAIIAERTDARIAFLELACASVRSLGIGDVTPPRGRPEIVDWFNDRIGALADRHPGLVQIISLNDRLCPDGEGVVEHDGVVLRDDGTHWTEASAPLAWEWLLPLLQGVAYRPIV